MGDTKLEGEIVIRQAEKCDMEAVVEMIQELAEFEKMPEGPQLTVKDLERDGFEADPPVFRCKVAEHVPPSGAGAGGARTVGYALYFHTYSTWEGRALMLEDLYVRAHMRRKGIGHKLFNAVAKEAYSSGCSRLDFHVLDWNEARVFYEALGATNLTESERWCYYRLAGRALKSLAEGESNKE